MKSLFDRKKIPNNRAINKKKFTIRQKKIEQRMHPNISKISNGDYEVYLTGR